MAGQRPTHDVMIAVEFDARVNGKIEKKTKWYQVGSAWQSDAGHVSFNMVTMPNVKLVLLPRSEEAAK